MSPADKKGDRTAFGRSYKARVVRFTRTPGSGMKREIAELQRPSAAFNGLAQEVSAPTMIASSLLAGDPTQASTPNLSRPLKSRKVIALFKSKNLPSLEERVMELK